MPKIDLSMLNQRQTPAFYADVLANRPAAGFIGRIFVSTNTYAFYRDNGTSWDLIGGPGTGTVTGSGTAGQVTYWDGASSITGSNNLFWDSANNRLGVNNTTPGASIDVHSAVSSIAQFNQTTATNNSLLVLQNSGSALWRLGNYYNAGANDFGFFDVVGNIQPLTIKKTSGQVLIGTSTVGSGKLVVASASSDNGIQIVGASAPSLRIDSAESGPTKRAGLGISTAVNNFIQGSADRDFCIFNGSTAAASPILFGIYDAGAVNVQEAARISAARNFLIGTTTDAGYKLNVQGTVNFSNSLNLGGLLAITYANARAQINSSTNTNSAYLSFSNTTTGYVGLDNSAGSDFGNGAYSLNLINGGAYNLNLGTSNTTRLTINSAGNVGISTNNPSSLKLTIESNGGNLRLRNTTTRYRADLSINTDQLTINAYDDTGGVYMPIQIDSSKTILGQFGNVLIGTTTDAGQKLQVNGTSLFSGAGVFQNTLAVQGSALNIGTVSGNNVLRIYSGTTGLSRIIATSTSDNGYIDYDNSINAWLLRTNGTTALTLKSNQIVNISNAPIYASNALALAGGLVTGDIYKSATGVLSIVY